MVCKILPYNHYYFFDVTWLSSLLKTSSCFTASIFYFRTSGNRRYSISIKTTHKLPRKALFSNAMERQLQLLDIKMNSEQLDCRIQNSILHKRMAICYRLLWRKWITFWPPESKPFRKCRLYGSKYLICVMKQRERSQNEVITKTSIIFKKVMRIPLPILYQ